MKCDIRKFFASIDQEILVEIVRKHITDQNVIWLIERIVKSFQSTALGKGLPLGNLTSQLLVNVYMNEFDQFVKHGFKRKYYIRYADDFVIMDSDRGVLMEILFKIQEFLEEKLKLKLHPNKVHIKTISSGIDFLGWVNFPNHKVLRTSTKWRMFKRLEDKQFKEESVRSYLGMLKHGNAYQLKRNIEDLFSKQIQNKLTTTSPHP